MTMRCDTGIGDDDPRSRSAALSCRQVAGANADMRLSVIGVSSVTESLLSQRPLVLAPLPVDTYTWPLRPTTGPEVAQMPASRGVGTAYEWILPVPLTGADVT